MLPPLMLFPSIDEPFIVPPSILSPTILEPVIVVPSMLPPLMLFPSIVEPLIVPLFTEIPFLSITQSTSLIVLFTRIWPSRPVPSPPTSSVPPLILSASIVPTSINSAFKCPSIVHALRYSPLIPFLLNPIPF